MEGLASLASNKPPRDWTDPDLNQAAFELAMPSEPSAAAEREQSAKRLTRASRLGDLVQKMAVKSCQNSYGGLRVHLYRVPRHTIRSKFYL
jgi:hypothetical protein